MEPERNRDSGNVGVGTNPATLLSSAAMSTLLAILVVTIAAIILDPPASGPFAASDGRAYLLIVLATAFGVGVWRSRAPGAMPPALARDIARGFLITTGSGFFLIGRIALVPILVVLVLATGLIYIEYAEPAQAATIGARTWLAAAALIWFALVGISSLEIEGRIQLPLVAAVSVAALLWHAGAGSDALITRATALTAGVIGAELALATSFLKISPYTEATLWMASAGLVGAGYLLAWRAATS